MVRDRFMDLTLIERSRRMAPIPRSFAVFLIALGVESLVLSPDFDRMPRNPDTSRGGNRGDPDSAEEPESSCSAEGLVTPLLGTQSGKASLKKKCWRMIELKPLIPP